MSAWSSEARVVARAVGAYGAAVAVGLAMLFAVDGGRWSGEPALFVVGLVAGFAGGALLALWRLRLWAAVAALWVVGFAVAWALPRGEAPLFAAWAGFQLAATSSFLFFVPRLDLVALWLPLALGVGAAIARLNRHGAVDVWRADKLAIWDAPSVAILGVTVVAFVAALAARHAVARARWVRRPVRVAALDAARGSVGGVVPLAIALLVLVLGVSPFRFRSRDARCDDATGERCAVDDHASSAPSSTATPSPPPSPLRDAEFTLLLQALREAALAFARGLAVAAAATGAVALVALPLVRRRRLRAMEEPAPTLPPTRRVELRFRRCLLAVAEDLGVGIDGGIDGGVDAPRAVVDAVHARYGDGRVSALPAGLADAVVVWEQTRFGGRGLPNDAEPRMAEAMATVLAATASSRSLARSWLLAFRLPA